MEEISFEVEEQQLKKDAAIFTQDLSEIVKELSKMYESMNQLNQMWKGPSNAAFKEQVKKDYADMVEICKILESYIDCMDGGYKEYLNAESKIEEMIENIDR